jgi:OFA family oxalate/formate antiporter-like MFS transporter
MWFGGYLAKHYHPRICILLGSAIALPSIFLCSLVHDFYLFLLLFGVGYGFGTSLLYIVPVQTGWKHFPNRKGIVSGIIIGSFGLGSFIFNMISTQLINPDNTHLENGFFPLKVAMRVPRAIQIMGMIWSGCVVVSLIMVSNPKKEDYEEMQVDTHERAVFDSMAFAPEDEGHPTLKQCLLSK